LIVGLRRIEAPARWSSMPAIADMHVSGSSPSGPSGANAFAPSLQHETWTWPLEPSSPGAVFARKLAWSPSEAATCLTANFTKAASSAERRPLRAARFSSSSPGPASVWIAESSTPSEARAGTRRAESSSKRPISTRL
jgi:hypothetical protein